MSEILCECGCGQLRPRFDSRGRERRFIRYHNSPINLVHDMGENHTRWNGGRGLTGDGYIWVLARDHPNAKSNGAILEHRLVMEKKLGRLLKREESVHHINGDKTDNKEENLMVFSTDSEHAKFEERSNTALKARGLL